MWFLLVWFPSLFFLSSFSNFSLSFFRSSFLSSIAQALIFNVTQALSTADCDLYLQFNALPTRYSYAARDITADQSVELVVDSPTVGVWYAGVYGFTQCSYTIRATQRSPCPNSCSGHGTCLSSGQCSCSAGYTGSDCSAGIIPLFANTPVTGSIASSNWLYYSYAYPGSSSAQAVRFGVTQASGSGDCDLYIAKGFIPSFHNFTWRDESADSSFSVQILQPGGAGTFYAGMLAFSGTCSYTMTVTLVSQTQQCTNQCSGSTHGTCSNGQCACVSSYSGAYCQQANFNMASSVTYLGYVDQGAWNYYRVSALSSQNVLLSMLETGSNSDCDLYVKAGRNPTRYDYDYADLTNQANSSVTIPDPGSTLWYVGIYGFLPCSYQIRGILTTSCPNGCSGHGTCSSGTCFCNPGYAGQDCGQTNPSLSSGQTITDSVANGQWKYYSISSIKSAATIHLLETASIGNLWLFASSLGSPTLMDYEYSSIDTNTNNHNIIISRPDSSDPTNYTLGVFGNPLAPSCQGCPSVSYQISLFLTPW